MKEPTSLVVATFLVVGGLYAMMLSQLILAFSLWGLAGYLLITAGSDAASSDSRTDGERVDGAEPTGTCAHCGAPVPAGRDRCGDCGVVGSWRK